MAEPKFFPEKDVEKIIDYSIDATAKKIQEKFKESQQKGFETVGAVLNDLIIFIAKVLYTSGYKPAFEIFANDAKHDYIKDALNEILQKLKNQ